MRKNKTQKDAGLINLIQLDAASIIDGICYHDEELRDDEVSPFQAHCMNLDEQICRALTIPSISSRFMKYYWHGLYEELPWSESGESEYGLNAFDPDKISLIIPVTGTILQIRGENRKIVLTFPATYRGGKPWHHVVCSSERQIENVRVLNPTIGNPFYGLERIFTPGGFHSLPKLGDTDGLGLIHVDRQQIMIPSTSKEYF